jgi:acyl-CoA thioester hydrolase
LGRFTHTIRVRYGECDQQGVVFNAHYLAYVDDALEHWFDASLSPEEREGFDVMLKKATVEWIAPARYRDHVAMDVGVARWGNTSFDVVVDGSAGGRASFVTTIVYVSVAPGTHDPVPVPEHVRAALSPTEPVTA